MLGRDRWRGIRHRYELLDQIGAGTHGTVWSAWDRERQREVAVKLAPRRSSPETEHRFFQERRLRVDHPHVLAAIDSIEHQGQLGFVMEMADAGDLAMMVEHNGPLTPEQVMLLAGQLLAGLGYLHGRGILHRDVKPSNVLFRTAGGRVTAALGDLGTALDLDGPRLTTFSQRIGTVGFMAPEVEQGEEASERSDLFSLGRTLEFALTGSTRTAPLRETLPEPLQQVLALLLEPNPAVRARDAGEASALLPAADPTTGFPDGTMTNGRVQSVRSTGSGEPTIRPANRRFLRRLVPLVVIAIASSALTYATVGRTNPSGRRPSDAGASTSTEPTRGPLTPRMEHSLALGSGFTCVLDAGGATRCIGTVGERPVDQADGQADDRNDREPVILSVPADAIWAGPDADGPCLTTTTAGMLGCLPLASSDPNRSTSWPTRVPIRSLAVSEDDGCAVITGRESGNLRCWGEHGSATEALAAEEVRSVSVASRRGCALMANDSLKCWTWESEHNSVHLVGVDLLGIEVVAVGSHGACATNGDGVWCWGDGASPLWPGSPRTVDGIEGHVDRLVVGEDHGCVLADGEVYCWGAVQSPTEDESRWADLRAVHQAGLESPTVDLAAGRQHSCARSSRDEVRCWGSNTVGQIDPSDTANWLVPTRLEFR